MKLAKSFISNINKVNIIEFMESEYDSGFIYSKSSNWANTNCPMPKHDDSSPSFGVSIDDNLYNCFGCGAKGDIIQLVQSVEGLTFIEAIQRISDYAGIEVELTNLDVKYLINEIQDSLNTQRLFNEDAIYPGRLTEANFLIAFSERTKKYIRNNNFSIDDINWIDGIYKQIDQFSLNHDMKSIGNVWKNFSKMIKERQNNV